MEPSQVERTERPPGKSSQKAEIRALTLTKTRFLEFSPKRDNEPLQPFHKGVFPRGWKQAWNRDNSVQLLNLREGVVDTFVNWSDSLYWANQIHTVMSTVKIIPSRHFEGLEVLVYG